MTQKNFLNNYKELKNIEIMKSMESKTGLDHSWSLVMKIKIIEELIKDEKFNLDYIYAADYIFFYFFKIFQ